VGLMKLLPPQLRKMEQMLPSTGDLWPRRVASQSVARAARPWPSAEHTGEPPVPRKVALFQGCIGQVMFDRVNKMSAELLAASGVELIAPRAETCCGAIHHHNGDHPTAADMARRNIDAFMPLNGPQPDVIVTNIAGCGAMLKDYDILLRDDPAYAERAKAFVAKVRDISEVLLDLPLPELKHPVNATATYHDACHLAHAQKVLAPPRLLLLKVPGLTMIMLPESDLCCGAAGTYNLTQPQMAASLAERKLGNIEATTAGICVAANVGCAMQIQSHADATGRRLKVLHPVELLHAAAFGSKV
jgi:glycolate oxidase iron-sulfur subunit